MGKTREFCAKLKTGSGDKSKLTQREMMTHTHTHTAYLTPLFHSKPSVFFVPLPPRLRGSTEGRCRVQIIRMKTRGYWKYSDKVFQGALENIFCYQQAKKKEIN